MILLKMFLTLLGLAALFILLFMWMTHRRTWEQFFSRLPSDITFDLHWFGPIPNGTTCTYQVTIQNGPHSGQHLIERKLDEEKMVDGKYALKRKPDGTPQDFWLEALE